MSTLHATTRARRVGRVRTRTCRGASLGLAAAILLMTGCTGTEEAGPTAPATQGSTATPTPTPGSDVSAESTGPDLPAGSDAPTDAAGHVRKELGAAAELLQDGAVELTVTVTAIQVSATCPGEFAGPSEHGRYVTLEVHAVRAPGGAPDDLILLGPSRWRVIAPDGSTDAAVETDAAFRCLATEERLPYTIAPGEDVTGKVVLDTAADAAEVAFVPSGTLGWSWPAG